MYGTSGCDCASWNRILDTAPPERFAKSRSDLSDSSIDVERRGHPDDRSDLGRRAIVAKSEHENQLIFGTQFVHAAIEVFAKLGPANR